MALQIFENHYHMGEELIIETLFNSLPLFLIFSPERHTEQ